MLGGVWGQPETIFLTLARPRASISTGSKSHLVSPLERPRGCLSKMPTTTRKKVRATPVYQRAVCSMPASHRKLGAQFSKISPYQTMCFGADPTV
jgi:hypothetical protein